MRALNDMNISLKYIWQSQKLTLHTLLTHIQNYDLFQHATI